MMKMRVQYAKEGRLRFLSHLDVQRTLARAFRRSGLPVAYSQGFSPHPRISFGTALATGVSSAGEFFDLDLTEPVEPAAFVAALNSVLPEGLWVVEAREAGESRESLMAWLNAAKYRLTLELGTARPQPLRAAVATFCAREAVMLEREGKKGRVEVDIRPKVYELTVEADSVLLATVQNSSEGSLKPAELLEGLKRLTPELQPASLQEVHRLACGRWDPEAGRLQLPWDL